MEVEGDTTFTTISDQWSVIEENKFNGGGYVTYKKANSLVK